MYIKAVVVCCIVLLVQRGSLADPTKKEKLGSLVTSLIARVNSPDNDGKVTALEDVKRFYQNIKDINGNILEFINTNFGVSDKDVGDVKRELEEILVATVQREPQLILELFNKNDTDLTIDDVRLDVLAGVISLLSERLHSVSYQEVSIEVAKDLYLKSAELRIVVDSILNILNNTDDNKVEDPANQQSLLLTGDNAGDYHRVKRFICRRRRYRLCIWNFGRCLRRLVLISYCPSCRRRINRYVFITVCHFRCFYIYSYCHPSITLIRK